MNAMISYYNNNIHDLESVYQCATKWTGYICSDITFTTMNWTTVPNTDVLAKYTTLSSHITNKEQSGVLYYSYFDV